MKRIILVLTAALLLAAMSVAVAPAMAQDQSKDKAKTEDTKDKGKEDTKDKGKEEEKKKEDLPKSGGVPVSASLLGLGAGVLLVGGGLVALRVVRQERH